MIAWLFDKWNERCRKVDTRLLWPICKEQCADLDEARGVFAVHAFMDPAWRCLGADEICRRIDRLD